MNINYEKSGGLVPVIVQDAATLQVLMLGFMNEEAYHTTLKTRRVTFFSRSRNKLWTKGETSGNFLHLREFRMDCDNDTLLALVDPAGPVCHTGASTCFGEIGSKGFLYHLEKIIAEKVNTAADNSYTSKLYKSGLNKIAQKVGEESVELIIEAKENNDVLFRNEAADLLFHLLVLFRAKGIKLSEVEEVLKQRNEQKRA